MRAKNASNKEFKTLVISILNELAESIDQNTDHLNKEPQNIKKWRKVKLKIDNSMFEIKKKKTKNLLEEVKSRLIMKNISVIWKIE